MSNTQNTQSLDVLGRSSSEPPGQSGPGIIESIGPCLLRPHEIVSGRSSARSSANKSRQKPPRRSTLGCSLSQAAGGHEPERLIGLGETGLRAAGLSGVKAHYVLNLAEAVRSNAVPLARIGRLTTKKSSNA